MALLSILAFIAVVLTWAMFSSRERMLGFPCVIFWALLGGQAYTLSTVPWGDIYYYLAFGSLFGMTIFTAYSAFALLEKRDTLADKEMEKGESGYVDEGKVPDPFEEKEEAESEQSERTKGIRGRAKKRRTES